MDTVNTTPVLPSLEDIIKSSPVLFFSNANCSYCDLLEEDMVSMNIPYKKVMLETYIRNDLVSLTKCKTVPQLFIGGKFIGGYKEFSTLCGTGKIISILEQYGITPFLDF